MTEIFLCGRIQIVKKMFLVFLYQFLYNADGTYDQGLRRLSHGQDRRNQEEDKQG